MRTALFALLVATALGATTGCSHLSGQSSCSDCSTGCADGACAQVPMNAGVLPRLHGHHRQQDYASQPGPPSGAITYPYYTTRGPRDYLAAEPPSIGR